MAFCPTCGREHPESARFCGQCGSPLAPPQADAAATQAIGAPPDGPSTPFPAATTVAGATLSDATRAPGASPTSATGPLAPGQAFGPRYHIIRLLGVGGMGAVYQAWDAELNVAVALKVIKPDVIADPEAARDIERRFKRELLLARQVTHKNVVRIHDLGELQGIKYITMPYIEGADLSHVTGRRLHRERQLRGGAGRDRNVREAPGRGRRALPRRFSDLPLSRPATRPEGAGTQGIRDVTGSRGSNPSR
jgi:hypothetical protein